VTTNNEETCATRRTRIHEAEMLSLPSALLGLIVEQLSTRALVAASVSCARLAAETSQSRRSARHDHYAAVLSAEHHERVSIYELAIMSCLEALFAHDYHVRRALARQVLNDLADGVSPVGSRALRHMHPSVHADFSRWLSVTYGLDATPGAATQVFGSPASEDGGG